MKKDTMLVKMNKKAMIARKKALAHDIRNLKDDYSGVLLEDLPQDVIDEVNIMMTELKELRELLGNV
jgi:uncharacterized protein HemX